ncbi:HIRAN domain-containing protein [Streptomyces sp. NPDC048155]|uniref:HIRAN domain-containing protein n=1 Tax=Streptomyces sp. NPDC048155 TaxID=3154818 RepID=UPI0034020915
MPTPRSVTATAPVSTGPASPAGKQGTTSASQKPSVSGTGTLDLVRDHDNPSDPNAIRVEHNGLPLGWIAKAAARPLALALDDRPAPLVTAVLHTDPRSLADIGQLAGHDQVELTITISPAPGGRGTRTSR